MQNLQNELINILQHEDALVVDGQLNKNKIVEMALQVDPQLIKHLIKHDTFKTHFFTDVEGVLVFDKIKFQRFVNNKSFLPDSYTAFKNKIGLTINDGTTDNYISTKNDVVLAWPHKDCVLEGGQTKEDQKRNEIFWNETLAPDEIDRLLDPKVFTNWKKYDQQGEHEVTEISDDDNLIIKGNNLLALASLRKRFKNRVKLIYIDPPYNTGSDSFQYNDSFNHSTWLTFMKNRLELAKEFLSQDGVIFIQIDERELAYLKVVADSVFGFDNFEIQINWQRTTQRSVLGQGATPIINIVEYILCYKKNIGNADSLNKIQKIIPSNDKMYNQYNLLLKSEGKRELHKVIEHNGQDIKIFKHSDFILESIPSKTRTEEYYKSNLEFIVRKDSQQQESSLEQLIMGNIEKNDTLFSVERILKQGKRKGELKKSLYMNDNVIYYLKEYAEVVDNKIFRKVDMNNLWLDYEISSAGIAEEGKVKLKRGKKPEQLIKRIIDIGTNSNKDIVLDFHLGSGTTCAVAHKLGLQYIGVEQLDYGKNDSVERLKNVIGKNETKQGELMPSNSFDQSGISKSVNWQGGGSFIYCELAKYNQTYADQILEADSKEKLIAVWQKMKEKAFLSYQFDKQSFDERIEAFKTLSLDDQKKFLLEVLDKNQLYVNFSEMADETFEISEADKRLNKIFYNIL